MTRNNFLQTKEERIYKLRIKRSSIKVKNERTKTIQVGI